jgi:nicotinamide mononucleotide transporter
MSPFEIIGTALGVVGVWLMIRQNVWGWPVGLVQVTVSAWVFYEAKLYSDTILQFFFFVIQAYGWWHWQHGADERRTMLPVTRLRARAIVGWSAVGLACTVGWGETMRRTTDAALPHWDAFILMFSLIAQWWQARKRLECWAGWMAVNLVAVGVYWAKDLRLYAGLYLVFFGMAVAGHIAWRKSMSAALQPVAAAATAGGEGRPLRP